MKNPIFTLLATASLLTATPVLAMNDTQQAPFVNVRAKVTQLTQSEGKETKSSQKKVGLPLGATMRPKLITRLASPRSPKDKTYPCYSRPQAYC